MSFFRAILSCLVLAVVTGCPGGTPSEDDAGVAPWTQHIEIGWFQVNSAPVVFAVYEEPLDDGIGVVRADALPDVDDLQAFAIVLYVPTTDAYSVAVDDVRVHLTRTDGFQTDEIFWHQGGYTAREGFHPEQLSGAYNETVKLTRETFASIHYAAHVTYLDSTGAIAASRDVTITVRKQDG